MTRSGSGWLALTTLCMAALCAATCLGVSAEDASSLVLHKTRQSESDLEIGGSIRGVPKGQTRFVTYDDLLKLP